MKLPKANAEHDEAYAESLLYQAFLTLKTPEEVKKFLQDLSTPAELQAMADRWLVVAPLKALLLWQF